MKSSLSGSALAVCCLSVLGSTAVAEYPVYHPSSRYSLPAAYAPPAQNPGQLPATPGEPIRTPIYPQNDLSEILGAPPEVDKQPARIADPHQQPLVPYQAPHSYGITPIGPSSLGCGGCGTCGSCTGCGKWFGGVSGLLMKPDRENAFLFSYDRANPNDRRTNSQDVEIQWGGGLDARFGRYFNCGRNGLEVVYWGLFPDSETTWTTASDIASGDLDAVLNWDSLTYGGVGADTLVNGAEIHQLWRDQEYHNVEINLLDFCNTCGVSGCAKYGAAGKCGSCKSCKGHGARVRNRCLLGFRWFKYHDNLLFGSDAFNRTFTFEPDEIYYNIELDNDLVGFQLGCEGEYCFHRCWTFDYGIKLGIYNNRISHTSEIGGAAGVATVNNGPNTGAEFFIESSKNDVAFLGEVNLGLEYKFSRCWTATFGYRALAATGVATPTNQIWGDLRSIQDVAQIDSNGSLILHGGYLGAEYNF